MLRSNPDDGDVAPQRAGAGRGRHRAGQDRHRRQSRRARSSMTRRPTRGARPRRWPPTAPYAAATLLAGGQVLVVGGDSDARGQTAELYTLPVPTTTTVSAPANVTGGATIPAGSIRASLSGATSHAAGTITLRVFGPQSAPPSDCRTGGTGWARRRCPAPGPTPRRAGSRRPARGLLVVRRLQRSRREPGIRQRLRRRDAEHGAATAGRLTRGDPGVRSGGLHGRGRVDHAMPAGPRVRVDRRVGVADFRRGTVVQSATAGLDSSGDWWSTLSIPGHADAAPATGSPLTA